MTPPHSADPATIAEYLSPIIGRELAVFQSLRYSSDAAPRYELLSDSVYWDDEVPAEPNPDVLVVMRYILRVRIELAQQNWTANDPTWDHFKKRLPSWPGSRIERCGDELLKLYGQGRADMKLADE
jgi:hypothetical protein